jgi:hypothetical protein
LTTIAFDGKVLASDSCWADEEVQIVTRTKICRLPTGALYGGAGGCDDRELIELLKKVKRPDQLPSLQQLGAIRQSLRALFILPNGRIFMLDTCSIAPGEPEASECGVVELDHPCAVGSGGKLALAAMRGGAGAYDAVRIACDLDTNSRPPIHRLTLNPKASFKAKNPSAAPAA